MFTVPTDASLKTVDSVGVELPCMWGSVLSGSASVGAVTLTGTDAKKVALKDVPKVEVDACSVSGRSVHVNTKPTVDAKTGAKTPNHLV